MDNFQLNFYYIFFSELKLRVLRRLVLINIITYLTYNLIIKNYTTSILVGYKKDLLQSSVDCRVVCRY